MTNLPRRRFGLHSIDYDKGIVFWFMTRESAGQRQTSRIVSSSIVGPTRPVSTRGLTNALSLTECDTDFPNFRKLRAWSRHAYYCAHARLLSRAFYVTDSPSQTTTILRGFGELPSQYTSRFTEHTPHESHKRILDRLLASAHLTSSKRTRTVKSAWAVFCADIGIVPIAILRKTIPSPRDAINDVDSVGLQVSQWLPILKSASTWTQSHERLVWPELQTALTDLSKGLRDVLDAAWEAISALTNSKSAKSFAALSAHFRKSNYTTGFDLASRFARDDYGAMHRFASLTPKQVLQFRPLRRPFRAMELPRVIDSGLEAITINIKLCPADPAHEPWKGLTRQVFALTTDDPEHFRLAHEAIRNVIKTEPSAFSPDSDIMRFAVNFRTAMSLVGQDIDALPAIHWQSILFWLCLAANPGAVVKELIASFDWTTRELTFDEACELVGASRETDTVGAQDVSNILCIQALCADSVRDTGTQSTVNPIPSMQGAAEGILGEDLSGLARRNDPLADIARDILRNALACAFQSAGTSTLTDHQAELYQSLVSECTPAPWFHPPVLPMRSLVF